MKTNFFNWVTTSNTIKTVILFLTEGKYLIGQVFSQKEFTFLHDFCQQGILNPRLQAGMLLPWAAAALLWRQYVLQLKDLCEAEFNK